MKAAYIEQTGPPEKIVYGDLPDPEPQGREVLVKVEAVAVNPVDTYIRNGANYWELPMPFIIGSDLAGVVVAVGPEAKRFRVGDAVWGTNQGLVGRQGTFAERCAVDEEWLYPRPSGVTAEEAAACALVGVTAHLGLFREAGLQRGEIVFVQGGSGGVGSMVVQMAKAAGAKVFATGGTDEKVEACRKFGADEAANYQTEDVDEKLKAFAPDGANVFWETQREPNFDEIVARMAERGRILIMAGREARPEFPVGPFYVKELSLHGLVMFKASPDELRVCGEQMNQWLEQGALKANISHRFPLSEAAKAHQLQEQNTLHKANTLTGKIVLNTGASPGRGEG